MKYLKNYNTFILERIDFDYNNQKLTTLIGLDISEIVDGYFSCSFNNLINLIGAPKICKLNFDCNTNNLTSLDGAPIEIGNSFYCHNNELTSLKGAPIKIPGDFWCLNNKLKNLDYLPEIGGDFYCNNNDWDKPIPYNIMIKYNLHCLKQGSNDYSWVYTLEQFEKFGSFEYQKEFLEREPENFIDLKLIGYENGIEELFPHLFDMDELGLLD